MNSQDPVSFEAHGDVAVVTVQHEQSRNALSPSMLDRLGEATAQAASQGMKALILASAGGVFCSGGDLTGVNEALDGDIDTEIGAMVDRLHRVIRSLRTLPMPTVAAVGGPAVGAGVALAMATDVRIISGSATFTTGYLAVGASPDGGASYHLARSLGEPRAVTSFLLNRRFTADEIVRVGLVDQLVEDSELGLAAVELGSRLARIPLPAVQAVRNLVYSASTHSLDVHLDAEREEFLRIAHTDGFRSGIAPFARAR